ncbi:hypothetical protein [Fulvivirga aurantia]|uniref:hypothetical protein n=1 Tax=Fulvivirga aurantia TaxID=2529383 RepID=UPI0012BC006F|nr:hypothetical protein [Fulvivirga aurantia]
MAFAIGIQVFNISLNQNDLMLGKAGNGFVFVNEIETVVEFIVEVIITGTDTIPETRVPGGSLGYEEEEKHLSVRPIDLKPKYNLLYVGLHKSHYNFNVKDYISEITTPPPRV